MTNRPYLAALAFTLAPAFAVAQSCPTEVGGESMARMIGEAGGAEALHRAAENQVVELDRWLAELEGSRNQGVSEDAIEELRRRGLEGRAINQQIADAARCYMGG